MGPEVLPLFELGKAEATHKVRRHLERSTCLPERNDFFLEVLESILVLGGDFMGLEAGDNFLSFGIGVVIESRIESLPCILHGGDSDYGTLPSAANLGGTCRNLFGHTKELAPLRDQR